MSEIERDAIDAAADALYGASLRAFTSERKRLVGELRRSGQRSAAATLLALPRPTMSAWAVNQLWRSARSELDVLFAAAARVRQGELAAMPAQRAALARLRGLASAALVSDGHAASDAVLTRTTTTLQALAAAGSFSPDAPGRLSTDRDPPGFDAMAAMMTAAARPAATPLADAPRSAHSQTDSQPDELPATGRPLAPARRQPARADGEEPESDRSKATTSAARRATSEPAVPARLKAQRARAEREKAEREKTEREKTEREKTEREKTERQKTEREKTEREKAEREKAEREKAEREKAEREKAERARAVERARRDLAQLERAAHEAHESARRHAALVEILRQQLERATAAVERAEAELIVARTLVQTTTGQADAARAHLHAMGEVGAGMDDGTTASPGARK